MQREGATLLDIGPGCSDLAQSIIESARSMDQLLILVDSQEMLSQLPEGEKVEKVPAFYPDCPELFARQQGNIDGIICYSVFQYIYAETNVWRFLDLTLGLLAPGGTLLIGDIPNRSMRNRFLASETGRAFHRSYMKNDSDPQIEYNRLSLDEIDDSVVCGLLMRARAAGFHGYVLPQPQDLPMANRREDLVIHRP